MHFEPKSIGTLPNLKSYINDMNKKTAKSYEKLQELLKELDKRARKYEERGGKFSREDVGSIIYTMMDDGLKKDVHRCKVVGDEKKLREHIFEEAAESRATSISMRKKPGAMDVDSLETVDADKKTDDGRPPAQEQAVAPTAASGGN